MANVDSPYGLKPVQHLNGATWNGQTRRFRVDATAGDLFVGSAVVWNGSGNSGYAEVIAATAGDGNKITGACTGFMAQPSYLDRIYLASADSGWAFVCCDPDVIFMIQDDGGGTLDSDAIGLNAVIIDTESGSTTTGLAGTEMDGGTTTAPSANASYQLLIVGQDDREDNEMDADNCDWLVLINQHSFRAVDANAGGASEGAAGV